MAQLNDKMSLSCEGCRMEKHHCHVSLVKEDMAFFSEGTVEHVTHLCVFVFLFFFLSV